MPIDWLTGDVGLQEPQEMDGTQSENMSLEKQSASVQLRCAWDERLEVMENILLNRLVWPYAPFSAIRAKNATSKPFANAVGEQDGNGYSYELALLTINFETMDVNEGDDPEDVVVYSESLQPTAEFLTIPYADFRWNSPTGKKLLPEQAPGRLEVGFDYVIQLFNLQTIPAEVLTLPGKVNSSDIFSPSLGLTFPAETLLFNPPNTSRQVSTMGANRYSIQSRLTFKSNDGLGWNWFWDEQNQEYRQIYHKDSAGPAYKNYLPGNFAGVLP